MVATYFDINPYLSAIAQNQLIITANNRLRNHLQRAYGQWQAEREQQVWPSPRIFSLSQWLEAQWSVLQRRAYTPAARRIINNLQRQSLWEKIIGESSLAQGLLQAEPLAQAADSALRSLELWQLSERDVRSAEPLINSQSNSECWLMWLGEFNARLSQLGFITQEAANQIIIGALRAGDLPQEPVIYLTGFDDIPPQHWQLLNSAGEHIISIKIAQPQVNLRRTELGNSEQEMRAAALWSKQQLEHNPAAMIGIIVPNLGQCRDQVERIFVEVFEPLAALPEQPRYTLPFNFSAGTPLATTPVIAAALELLELYQPAWELERVCSLLFSPFFGDGFGADDNTADELRLRAQWVERLRKAGRSSLSLSDLRFYGTTSKDKTEFTDSEAVPAEQSEQPKSLLRRLTQLENLRRQTLGSHPAAYWCDFFQRHLHCLGWPGSRRLDSQEYQQVSLWNQVMEQFAQLDGTAIRFSYAQAVKQLRNIAGKTPFQAQTPHSPIQILGALEGAGLQFSHCWVMGLHHRQWPPVPAPNPLLPSQLQRQQKIPHASAERELEFARALTAHYQQCAPLVIFSCAQSDDDSELSPSALIRHVPLTPAPELLGELTSASAENYTRLAQTQALELVDCASAPPVDIAQEPVRGGASVFKEQAACPFNAFARLRLGAKQAEAPELGLSAIERGNLLHLTLADLWREVQTHAQLISLDEANLRERLNTHCQTHLNKLKQQRGKSLGHYYAQLEQERLVALLGEWLALEKTRPPFKVIAIEQDVELNFAGLPLNLRIDRLDEFANQQHLLIDYKTGQPKASSWQGERMDEPQLPLYAVTASEPVAAIAFAQINAKAMQWIGTGDLHINHPGINPGKQEWQNQLDEWRDHLTQLAQDFIQGDARVDMKNPSAAQYAEELLPLNRLPEADAITAFIQRQQGAV